MKSITAILLGLVIEMIQRMTPELRKLLCNFLFELNEKAKKTDNPVDDLFCMLFLGLLACDEEEQK